MQTIERGINAYAFGQAISPDDLELSDTLATSEVDEAARQVFAARAIIDASEGVHQLLKELRETPDGISDFVCMNLRSQIFARGSAAAAMDELLSNDEWRQCVFDRLPPLSMETLFFFVTEWQLQRDDDWNVRVPHVLAYEFERVDDPKRRTSLLIATLMSSMAADIASPLERLLRGERRNEVSELLENWRETARQIALESEPWVAGRVRGFFGTIERNL